MLCLQELKCTDEQFPRAEIEDAGYNALVHGQKSWNGVAILSKRPLEETQRGLPGAEDEQSRYLEALTQDSNGAVMRVASIYLPNGNPAGTEKTAYKWAWMDRLRAHAKSLLAQEEPLVLAGDYNVIPAPEDAKHPEAWTGDALFLPDTRKRFRTLINLGFTDALRACSDAAWALHVLVIIRPAPGSETTASESTICCCRRRPPTGWRRWRSTRTCARRKSLRNTCRFARYSGINRRAPPSAFLHVAFEIDGGGLPIIVGGVAHRLLVEIDDPFVAGRIVR